METIVVNHNVASTGQPEWYPVAFFLKGENGELLGGLLGDIWAAWPHVRILAVAMPVRGKGFGKELMKRAENYAIERGCTDAFLDTFSFQARPIYEKLGFREFGTLENHPVGHEHYFMTKKLVSVPDGIRKLGHQTSFEVSTTFRGLFRYKARLCRPLRLGLIAREMKRGHL